MRDTIKLSHLGIVPGQYLAVHLPKSVIEEACGGTKSACFQTTGRITFPAEARHKQDTKMIGL